MKIGILKEHKSGEKRVAIVPSTVSALSKKGYEDLKEELQKLKSVDRPQAINQIAEARDKGDLSENAEYDAAKEAQGLLEARIAKLEADLSNSRIIDESKLDNSNYAIKIM